MTQNDPNNNNNYELASNGSTLVLKHRIVTFSRKHSTLKGLNDPQDDINNNYETIQSGYENCDLADDLQKQQQDAQQQIVEEEVDDELAVEDVDLMEESAKTYSYKWSEIVWPMILKLSFIHVLGAYGLYLALTGHVKWQTVWFSFVIGSVSAFGTTAGVHRLWCHRSYKATWPLRAFLAYLFSMTLQYNIYEWARDHRVHHKYTETNADPHNAHRGFFFSHIGWLMVRKHPDVIAAGKRINMDDVWRDPIVRFQKKYFALCVLVAWGVVPTFVPWFFWGENWVVALAAAAGLRSVVVLHYTFMINSVAHMFGNRPFNENIGARDHTKVAHFTMGEGYHNYHHTFPWDYSSAELGFTHINLTTAFIDLFGAIGWAYDRRTTSAKIVESRRLKTGDGFRPASLPDPHKPLSVLDYLTLVVYFTCPIWIGYSVVKIISTIAGQ